MIDLSEIAPKPKDRETYRYIEDYPETVGVLRRIVIRGGPGSGHHGHEGRPGQRGGSQPGAGGGPSAARDFMAESPGKGGFPIGAREWGETHFSEWAKGLTALEKEGIALYRSNAYRPINQFLREGKVSEDSELHGWHNPEMPGMVAVLDSALASATMPEDAIVYRAARLPAGVDLKPGATFKDDGFASASLYDGPVRNLFLDDPGEVLMRIRVPAGTHAAYTVVATPTILHTEAEILLPRGTRFRVTSVGPGREVDLEVVPNG